MLFWPHFIVVGVFTVKRYNSKVKTKKVEKKVGPKKKEESKNVEEELADFRIGPPPQQTGKPQKNSKKKAKWVKPGERVKVGKVTIQRGFFYLGGQLNGLTSFNGDSEASLVDPTLKIDSRSPDYAGDQMGYWPSYSRLHPKAVLHISNGWPAIALILKPT